MPIILFSWWTAESTWPASIILNYYIPGSIATPWVDNENGEEMHQVIDYVMTSIMASIVVNSL